jgi:aspartate carbamoyltransferase catalytic subunit
MTSAPAAPLLSSSHLLGIEGLSPAEITALLDLAETYVVQGRSGDKKTGLLKGRTLINLFFEASTRTQSSFELAGKRLGADVLNMSVKTSSVSKGETLIDTATTLNAMRPDLLVVRHQDAGAAELLARKVDCCVINAGDGAHEHPTQALLDAFTIRRHKGRLAGLRIAVIGDIEHSRVVRSNVHLLTKMGATVVVGGPRTMIPVEIERMGVEVAYTLEDAIRDADVIMMLRIQLERQGKMAFPSIREYFQLFGLTTERLAGAKEDVIIMHPGPMNRGVEIASEVADGPYSVILEQVTHGVSVRMAVLYLCSMVHEEGA